MVKGIRGAIFLEANSVQEIDKQAVKLYKTLLEKNKIDEKDIISLIITQTKNLTKRNSATSLRKAGFASNICLMCMQEAYIEGSQTLAIRMLITFNTEKKDLYPIYLDGAEKLRPDLNQK